RGQSLPDEAGRPRRHADRADLRRVRARRPEARRPALRRGRGGALRADLRGPARVVRLDGRPDSLRAAAAQCPALHRTLRGGGGCSDRHRLHRSGPRRDHPYSPPVFLTGRAARRMGTGDLNVGWDEYHRLVERLALQIHDSGWRFDAIVCLARGGLRVGDILSRIFDRPLGVMFTSSYREPGGRAQGEIRIGEDLCAAQALPGTHWLLVDDLVDSGHTLAEVLRILPARHPQLLEVRSAVIW